MRLFWAIDVDEEITSNIGNSVRFMRDLGKHVKPVRAGGIHLTLLFLGEQDESSLSGLLEIGNLAVGGAKPCHLEAGPVGFFPSVSYLTLSGDVYVLSLMSTVLKDACENYLEKPDKRPFTAHITLARHKKKITRNEKEMISKEYADLVGMDWVADELVLYQSELTPKGAIYTVIEKFKFGW